MMIKNFILKGRLFWKQTIWEFVFPLFCGIIFGFSTRFGMIDQDGDDAQAEIIRIGLIFSFGLLFCSGSYAGTCCFVLNEVVEDKESRMRETLRIMSLNRWSYAMSYFLK